MIRDVTSTPILPNAPKTRPAVDAPASVPTDRVEISTPVALPTPPPPRPALTGEVEPEKGKQLPHPADPIVCDQPLGALFTPDATTFRVWAPTADKLTLRLYEAPEGGNPRLIEMKKHPRDGSWEAVVPGACKGMYYTYSAAGSDPGFNPSIEIVDPYARAVTAFDGRAIVVDDHTPVAPRPQFPAQDAIIYEMHIRDFTIDPDSSVQQRGKYSGVAESGRTLFGRPDIPTGLDHLTELGVNAVQIMPFTEFASDEKADRYGWGYDAIHYNTPDGWYASDRTNDSRVRESKQMIDALHRRGIRVIMDAVYNHTVEDIKKRAYSFEALVPGYYYRRHLDGSYWNGSACGNEVRSEAPMARRFIKDSVKQWVTDYQVDGFRFDLMGLIDLQTMKELTRELHAIDPNLLIYGEPWAAGDTPIDVTNKGKQRGLGFSVFNDHFRDALKGSVFDARDRGFVQDGSHRDEVRRGIQGSINDFADAPTESLNYVECHDNHTLWDRLLASTFNDPRVTDADRRAMDKMAAAILFTSFGIPFIQSGQEMLRTKFGDDNSYDKPDSVNMIRWEKKVENHDVFDYYQGLIALRKAHSLFRLAKGDDVRRALRFFDTDLALAVPDRTLGYLVEDAAGQDAWKRAAVLLNADDAPRELPVPPGNWQIFVDGMDAGNSPLTSSKAQIRNGLVHVPPHTAVVLGEPR